MQLKNINPKLSNFETLKALTEPEFTKILQEISYMPSNELLDFKEWLNAPAGTPINYRGDNCLWKTSSFIEDVEVLLPQSETLRNNDVYISARILYEFKRSDCTWYKIVWIDDNGNPGFGIVPETAIIRK